jgi:hypothetical protein
VIVGIADVNVHVVALVFLLQRVHLVDPSAVRSAGPVPGQARLGIDGALRLGRYVVEPSNVSVYYEVAVRAESRRTQAIRIEFT